ncbi:phosphoribosylaminoimidazole synthetase [Lysobacter daejeonensis GH1-9]|uniref:Phosphoribosylformylglycinamidine cyclo-ligase n=1 Tax=Lysobacter daejeonensis GH1-9 TaxID=1385517 RepID=A0A0A0EWA2_9GAMM|nr:phosphoribosylformylglycinamidine cyclo-ligase [Lysobacter daejeonensis]KGM54530.1 phosphoribosylaminoimidazole synthetase [Lysobacter daejeonensis GH1-9]
MTSPTPLTYRDAGVDIDAGNEVVERIKPLVKRTMRPEVLGGVGLFGGLFDVSGKYREPVLVSGTDGVGTKLILAKQLNRHDTIGIDLVAMCVNDVLVQGAEPLFFLDYFATGKLDVATTVDVVGGIAKGCEIAGCALIGGETAEMPDMYPPGEYDLAGFTVGAVEKAKLIDSSKVRAGDVLIGIASSGPHSNGYSLVRKILARAGNPLDLDLGGVKLADALMEPTRIYVKPVLELLARHDIHAMAHVTGGALVEKIIRVVPQEFGLEIDTSAWPLPAVFDWLQREGNVPREEMWRTFNCGVGFVLIVAPGDVAAINADLDRLGLAHWQIGQVTPAGTGERLRIG